VVSIYFTVSLFEAEMKDFNKLLQNVVKIPLFCVGNLVYLISHLVPKDKNLWVFGAWFGEKYADNSKYLFEYVNENHPEIRTVWLTRNQNTLQQVRRQGYEAHLGYSLKGHLLSMKAGVAVVSTSELRDINGFALSSNTQLVQLWHGTALKKIMFDDKMGFGKPSLLRKLIPIIFPFCKKHFDFTETLLIATSDTVKKKISCSFRVEGKNVKITGYPRTDSFFKPEKNIPLSELLTSLRKRQFKIGIYMPTHRREGKSDITSLLPKDLERFDTLVGQHNVFLLIKLHFYHLKALEGLDCNFKNVLFIRDKDIEQDIYTILPYSDFLITDYSSVYLDYLLTDKPIIFAPFDMEEYIKNDREFYYNYEDVTPGPKAKNWDEVLYYIEEATKEPGKYGEERRQTREIFHAYVDGNSSARVFDAISKDVS